MFNYSTFFHPNVSIIQQSNGLLAVYKPHGVLSHPNTDGVCNNSLMVASYDFQAEAYRCNGNPIYLLNRLDSPTSGLVLLCLELKLAQKIRMLFRDRKVYKAYYALVKGSVPKQMWWEDQLEVVKTSKTQQHLRARCVQHKGITAKTQVTWLETLRFEQEVISLVRLRPITGRTHQLRIQCATHGFPILGDKTYGQFNWNRKLQAQRLYLHAAEIKIDELHFEAYCEPDFAPFQLPGFRRNHR